MRSSTRLALMGAGLAALGLACMIAVAVSREGYTIRTTMLEKNPVKSIQNRVARQVPAVLSEETPRCRAKGQRLGTWRTPHAGRCAARVGQHRQGARARGALKRRIFPARRRCQHRGLLTDLGRDRRQKWCVLSGDRHGMVGPKAGWPRVLGARCSGFLGFGHLLPQLQGLKCFGCRAEGGASVSGAHQGGVQGREALEEGHEGGRAAQEEAGLPLHLRPHAGTSGYLLRILQTQSFPSQTQPPGPAHQTRKLARPDG